MKIIVLRYKIGCYFLSLEQFLNHWKKGPIYHINHIYSLVNISPLVFIGQGYVFMHLFNSPEPWLESAIVIAHCPSINFFVGKINFFTFSTSSRESMKRGRDEILMVPYKCCCFYTPELSGRIIIIRPICRDVLWYGVGVCPSVCPSVCGSVHKACKHNTDWTIPARTVKLGTHTTYDKRSNPIDFQGHGSKFKITCYTLMLNHVNTIQTEPFQLGPSNFVHILLMTRGGTLLIFKVMGQRSRSHTTHCC